MSKKSEIAEMATQMMAALTNAGWSNPGPSGQTYREWKAQQPPTSTRLDYRYWLAELAVAYAEALHDTLSADPEATC